jgi:hypothetical protein
MVSLETIAGLKKTLEAERGRDVSDREVAEVLDYLYALADLIFESWQVKTNEKNKIYDDGHDQRV